MECAVCLRDWDSTECIPRMLSCGHSFCEQCLDGLYKMPGGEGISGIVTCPSCNKEHKFNSKEELSNLVKNFALIQMGELKS